jgi:hypothetical protein
MSEQECGERLIMLLLYEFWVVLSVISFAVVFILFKGR